MRNFKIVPLSEAYVKRIKSTLKDDFGHEVLSQLAMGYGPCRYTLKPFRVGQDQRLLFCHSPFQIDNVFHQPGPIFIHQEDTQPYTNIYEFPKEIKADKVNFPLTLIGYNSLQNMVLTKMVGDGDVDELIEQIFNAHAEVAYLHVRNAEACCYICKVERL